MRTTTLAIVILLSMAGDPRQGRTDDNFGAGSD